MECTVTLTSLAFYVNPAPHQHLQAYTIFVLLLSVFLVEILVVIHRHYGSLPADLDRVGREIRRPFLVGIAREDEGFQALAQSARDPHDGCVIYLLTDSHDSTSSR